MSVRADHITDRSSTGAWWGGVDKGEGCAWRLTQGNACPNHSMRMIAWQSGTCLLSPVTDRVTQPSVSSSPDALICIVHLYRLRRGRESRNPGRDSLPGAYERRDGGRQEQHEKSSLSHTACAPMGCGGGGVRVSKQSIPARRALGDESRGSTTQRRAPVTTMRESNDRAPNGSGQSDGRCGWPPVVL